MTPSQAARAIQHNLAVPERRWLADVLAYRDDTPCPPALPRFDASMWPYPTVAAGLHTIYDGLVAERHAAILDYAVRALRHDCATLLTWQQRALRHDIDHPDHEALQAGIPGPYRRAHLAALLEADRC